MRNPRLVVLASLGFVALLSLVRFGGSLERWLLRLHGIPVAEDATAASTLGTPAPGDTSAAAAAREGWPATPAGVVAHRWVRAFSTGESAMRECLAQVMAPASLAKAGVPVRVERYRDLHERFGTLTLLAVSHSEPTRIEVSLAAADLSPHTFVFEAQPTAPYKLVQVSMREPGHMALPGFGH